MKRLALFTGCLLLIWTFAAWAAPPNTPYTANAGLTKTPHDFTQGYTATTTPGLCTSCHTPHKAQSTALLWNHKNAAGPWKWADTTKTAAGTDLPDITNTWNGPTPKCLSCHDGTVAVGDVTWFDAKAQDFGVSGSGLTAGKISDTAYQVGATNLNGNHPVAVPYPVGQLANTYNSKTNGAALVGTEFVSDPTAGKIVLYADNAGSVSRVTSAAAGTNNGIECASCHDPHNKGGTDADKYFLRGKLSGTAGYICTKCHIK